ncbi:MAG: xanthine dehydrogenase family protein subunit M [Spirochaetaceae bacterium]|jgi:CO/xanthine dehydrogenase FAD-binding subunit|nr:xanthine dehydrogenase family protein subunit M [Spirochaetaceae bacterium]
MLNFDYRKPTSIEDALSLRNEWGKSSSLLSGGTDLFLAIEEGLKTPTMLIDLKSIKELDGLDINKDSVFIGAGVTYSSLIKSSLIKKNLPAIWESSRLVASMGVRNSATLIGNICNAVPSAESAAPLLVRDSLVNLSSLSGNRIIPIGEFFTGPRKTVVGDNEIVTSVSVPLVHGEFGEAYVKLGRYRGEDIAQVAVAVLVDSDWKYRIAYAAVGPVPMRIPDAEFILEGKTLTPGLIEKAVEAIIGTVSPITDIRASKEYRIHMCRIMFEKAVKAAVSRMVSSQPEYGSRLL